MVRKSWRLEGQIKIKIGPASRNSWMASFPLSISSLRWSGSEKNRGFFVREVGVGIFWQHKKTITKELQLVVSFNVPSENNKYLYIFSAPDRGSQCWQTSRWWLEFSILHSADDRTVAPIFSSADTPFKLIESHINIILRSQVCWKFCWINAFISRLARGLLKDPNLRGSNPSSIHVNQLAIWWLQRNKKILESLRKLPQAL